jgi:hypothetical protein
VQKKKKKKKKEEEREESTKDTKKNQNKKKKKRKKKGEDRKTTRRRRRKRKKWTDKKQREEQEDLGLIASERFGAHLHVERIRHIPQDLHTEATAITRKRDKVPTLVRYGSLSPLGGACAGIPATTLDPWMRACA